ncbi:MAG: hypothetical protein GF349_03710 [Candidatus Magasanikbacteria bacterium]|nr:hypothetical protein [Candidatus Magasanikbacteria bacterium]
MLKKYILLVLVLVFMGAGCENINQPNQKSVTEKITEFKDRVFGSKDTVVEFDKNVAEEVFESGTDDSEERVVIEFGLDNASCEFLGTRQSFNVTLGQIKLLTFWAKANKDSRIEKYPMDIKFSIADEVFVDKLYIRKKGTDDIIASPIHLDRYIKNFDGRVKALGGDFIIDNNPGGEEKKEYFEVILEVIYPTYPITEAKDKLVNFSIEVPVRDWLIKDDEKYISQGISSDAITVDDRIAAFCVIE